MSIWNAINVELEDDETSEIDDSKEILLEEAFKLYQNALKLHSQGPAWYADAREAYNELFDSDIFKYPEAISEFDNDQQDEITSATTLPAEVAALPPGASGASDNSNSLPQLIYLAYKSRAQFEVDSTHHFLDKDALSGRSDMISYYAPACRRSLIDAAIALERDDTDLDLWKRAARVSDVLQSIRALRFCLESVLAGDDDGDDGIDLSGLDEAFAKGELQTVTSLLEDSLAISRDVGSQPRKILLSLLKASCDPYPFLPQKATQIEYMDDSCRPLMFGAGETRLRLSAVTHEALAQALLQLCQSHDSGTSDLGVGGFVKLDIPSTGCASDIVMAVDSPMHSVNSATSPEVNSPASFHSVPERAPATQTIDGEQNFADQMTNPSDEQSMDADTNEANSSLAEPNALPSRKRSSTAAGVEEPEARIRSKRIKARESLAGTAAQEDEVTQDPSSLHREQYSGIELADDMMFRTINLVLEKAGIRGVGAIEDFRSCHFEETDATMATISEHRVFRPFLDLKHALQTWSEEKSSASTNGHGIRDHVEDATGMALFLKHSKSVVPQDLTSPMIDDVAQIRRLCQFVTDQSVNVHETVFFWLIEMLTSIQSLKKPSPYLQGSWTDRLKEMTLQILIQEHESIVSILQRRFSTMGNGQYQTVSGALSRHMVAELAQSIFELHLDRLSELTGSTSTSTETECKQQRQRLHTWAQIVTDLMQNINDDEETDRLNQDPLIVRFLWASVGLAKLSEAADKSHILLCLEDLKVILSQLDITEFYLPNNTTMPFISSAAVDQEISRVKTLEFFTSVFEGDNSDSLSVIMKLEPILEFEVNVRDLGNTTEREHIENFCAFLKAGSASLTLFLWKKLRNAYTSISYNTKVLSCLLRSIETIADEILSLHQKETEAASREIELLRWLRDVDELVMKALPNITTDKNAFDCIDENHLRSSVAAVVTLLRVLYEFVMADDCLRIGFSTPPIHRNATAAKNFEKSRDRFREMYVRLWTLLYLMVKELMVQLPSIFEDSPHDLILILRSVHASLGGRQYCRYCSKLFVRTAKSELFSFETEEDLFADVAQIIYDLYQIKLGGGSSEVDHGCAAETLDKDKKTAHMLVPIIMDFVRRMNMKELLRNDVKPTIDRIQAALGQVKPSLALSFNRKTVSAYLKSLISPKQLYQSLRGVGELETKAVHGDFASIASAGWYLLQGNIALAKYRSIKRVNPTPTDDLDHALTYLRLDLEHNSSNWESWYRLAQVHDAKIEDSLIWNTNKLNDARAEIATLERTSINAYCMATAIALRSASDDHVTVQLMRDMFYEFGLRLYSSSRPPLNMVAFNTDKAVRHLSSCADGTMSKQLMIRPIDEYHLWSYTVRLINKSLSGDQQPWIRYYYLGKCMWKMFNREPKQHGRSRGRPVGIADVIDAFTEAVQRVPKKEKATDPILEPHFKLVSTIHKLYDRKLIDADIAVRYLQATPYSNNATLPVGEDGNPEWETYILLVLKRLQNADKSSWHHRITARAAHISFGEAKTVGGALVAKHYYVDSIFTKTMMMQVWKPEHERAGRHYVYTGRYLRFFIEILNTLRDRSNLEQVVRKIRRKTTDFIDHAKVWEEAVTTYIDLLRSLGNVPRGRERELFDSISFDEFTRRSDELEVWAHDPQTTTSYLDTIKDAIEMKKLNNSLMKSTAIDDLIGDAYACMYDLWLSQTPQDERTTSNVAQPQGMFINLTSDNVPPGDDSLGRMRLNNLLSDQPDGPLTSPSHVAGSTADLDTVTGPQLTTDTLPLDVPRLPGHAKPGRTKTITRREVQRKAESAIGKPPPIKTPTLSKRSISLNVPSIRKDGSADRDEHREGSVKRRTGLDSGFSSRRGSIGQSPDPEMDAEDEGGDGDNEEEDDEDNENAGSETEDEKPDVIPKRLFGSTTDQNMDEDMDEAEEEDDVEESGDGATPEEHQNDKDGVEVIEIPDSQDADEIEDGAKERMDMD